jgi:molybdopterin synthase catalytic subunit
VAGITRIRVGHEDFDVSEQMRLLERPERTAGAVVSFTGVVRSDSSVVKMELEHYPGMTEKALHAIAEKARSRWALEDIVVIHSVGELSVGEQIVLCMVTATHRREAFEACLFIMDWLKTEAPFWKKETHADGTSSWVDARESDEQAKERWGEA